MGECQKELRRARKRVWSRPARDSKSCRRCCLKRTVPAGLCPEQRITGPQWHAPFFGAHQPQHRRFCHLPYQHAPLFGARHFLTPDTVPETTTSSRARPPGSRRRERRLSHLVDVAGHLVSEHPLGEQRIAAHHVGHRMRDGGDELGRPDIDHLHDGMGQGSTQSGHFLIDLRSPAPSSLPSGCPRSWVSRPRADQSAWNCRLYLY